LYSVAAPRRCSASFRGSSKWNEATLTLSPNGFGRFGCPVSVFTFLPDSSRRPVMYLPVRPNAPVTTSTSGVATPMRHRLPLVAGMSLHRSRLPQPRSAGSPSPVRRMIGDVVGTMMRAPGCRFRYESTSSRAA